MFDLHLHSRFSDGSLTPKNAEEYLKGHLKYRTVTDHNMAEFHRQAPNYCSFTGMEIASYYEFKGDREFAELLLFGFDIDNELIKGLETYNQKNYSLINIEKLSQHLQPLLEAGALLFLAHPSCTYQTKDRRVKVLQNIAPFVDGFECLHSCFNQQDAVWILDFCRENGKLATGGSDSHNVPLFQTPHLELVSRYEDLFSWILVMAELYRKREIGGLD